MKTILILILSIIFIVPTQGQLKKLGKKLESKVKQRAERKVDRTIDKGLDKAEGGIDNASKGKKGKKTSDGKNDKDPGLQGDNSEIIEATSDDVESSKGFTVTTKFDYVPGNKLMVTEDFSRDNIGDFPARWNTNGSGEIVTSGGDNTQKWFKMVTGSTYIPDLPYTLPAEYTIEFDIEAIGLDNKTSSQAFLNVILDDNNGFNKGSNRVEVKIPFCQYSSIGMNVSNHVNKERVIYNTIKVDIREDVLNRPHISIAVNKTRYRLWVNEKKYVDIPRLVPTGGKIGALKFQPLALKDGKETVFISNVKIAEGGLDLRSQLLSEGKVSTTGILFNVNSDQVKPESYGVIREISMAMQSNSSINVLIVGHTDSDGEEKMNEVLSKKRADAVKQILVKDYKIAAQRLSTKGKGEAEPVTDNNTPEGKAGNRRVEFIVQ